MFQDPCHRAVVRTLSRTDPKGGERERKEVVGLFRPLLDGTGPVTGVLHESVSL